MAATTTDWLIAAGAAGGLIWYLRHASKRREQEAREQAEVAERVAYALGRLDGATVGDPRGAFVPLVVPAAPTAPAVESTPAVHAPAPSAPSPPPASAPGITREFDALFARHGGQIPVPYLRALAQAESGMRPNDPLGLINITPIALEDYNRRHPDKRIQAAQMRDPATNIAVVADILGEIIASYERNHGDVPNLRAHWTNPRFAELLTLGWTGGHSERSGVGKVVRYLKSHPAAHPDGITVDTIQAAAERAGASRNLANRHKVAYSKGVAVAFARELARDQRERASAVA
jgi:hypothetical protein